MVFSNYISATCLIYFVNNAGRDIFLIQFLFLKIFTKRKIMKNLISFLSALFLLLIMSLNPCLSQWVITNGPPEGNTFPAMASNAAGVYVSNYGYVMPLGIYRTTNNGTGWSLITPYNRTYYSITSAQNALFAGGDSGIYKSLDNGLSWLRMGLQSNKVISIYQYGSYLFAGTNAGVYRADTSGTTWTSCGLSNQVIYGFTSNSTYLFAANFSDNGVPIYRSSNNGLNWTEIGTGYRPLCLASIGSSYIFEGSTQGLLRSTDNGINWWHVLPASILVRSLLVYNNTVFAGSMNGLYVSTNNGTNWELKNEGLTNGTDVASMSVHGYDIYAGINYGKVWKRPLSQLTITEISGNTIPESFLLNQNYPNPFNPCTVIRFQVPVSSEVNISVFDALGKKVSEIASESLKPGIYKKEFDGSNLAGGVYFCNLKAGEYSKTIKMFLLK